MALSFVAVTVWVTLAGLVGLGFTGHEDQLRISQCRHTGGGRGGSYVECTGSLVADVDRGAVRIRVSDGGGTAGKLVRVARTPWGTYAVVDTGFISWATTLLYSLLSVIAAALIRRAGQHDCQVLLILRPLSGVAVRRSVFRENLMTG